MRAIELALRGLMIARASREQPEVQAWHGERGVEVGRRLVMSERGRKIACTIATEREQIVGTGVLGIEAEQVVAGALSVVEKAALRAQRSVKEARIRARRHLCWEPAHPLERLRQSLLGEQAKGVAQIGKRCG
jgi:hypothetical protein